MPVGDRRCRDPRSQKPRRRRKPCRRATVGLLSRRPIKVAAIHHIGKESNRIEEAISGLVTSLDDVLTEYTDPEHDSYAQLAAPILREVPVAEVAAHAGVTQRTVRRARAGQSVGKAARAKLTAFAIKHARSELRAAGIRPPADHEALLATYLDRQPAQTAAEDPDPLCACGCGQPVAVGRGRGRPRRYIDETHRKRARRQNP
jgi:hypothetical protein